MVDLRIYRLGFLALVPAVIALLFTVEPIADPLPPGIATTGFDGRAAASIAREIESLGEERTPGSEADTGAARLIAGRFGEIPAGSLVRIPVAQGELTPEPSSETVAVSLPGETDEAILVVARRTAASTAGRLATATASGVVVQLAGSFGEVRHESELIFASVPDAPAAADLAERVAADRRVIASLSIDDARGIRTGDVLLHRAPGDQLASSTLAETAREVIGGEGGPAATAEPALGQVARLAVGLAFGTQARLLGEGINAIALSATGELPPREGDGAPVKVLSSPLEVVGEIALRVVQALDATPELPDDAAAYVRFGDNVVPGWAFGLLALALVIPALFAAVDALARSARRGKAAAEALRSALARSLPFAGAVALLYLLSGTGALPDPEFPFDPAEFTLGGGEIVALAGMAILALAIGAVMRVDVVAAEFGAPALAAAAGLVASLAVLGIWTANPFAALLAVPIAHVWIIACREQPPNRLLVVLAAVLSLAPLLAAIDYVAGQLELGGDAPWTIAMLITGGELRAAQVLIACALGGALLSVVAASTRRAPR